MKASRMKQPKTIKSIEVSDFRGLVDKRVLEFDDADIVLFVGLNGFGKTSIFDAVEWGFTGKLGRFSRYTESGRKQDFGREKEVLRNKDATNPNTYVKLTLSDNTVIGRKILAKPNMSDYNEGQQIDGCAFGLSTLSKETIPDELANSYFSATHILSQETINDFVTSKKPEERYKALSINFGTSAFSSFEDNIHTLITEVSEREKKIKSEIMSKEDIVKELESQLKLDENNIKLVIEEANNNIDSINEDSLDIHFSKISMVDSELLIERNFDLLVSNSKSRTMLDLNGAKERLSIIEKLEKHYDGWIANKKTSLTKEAYPCGNPA